MAQSERPPRGDGRCGKEGGVAARAGDTVPIGCRRPALSRSAGFTIGCARVAAPSYSGPVHQALADHLLLQKFAPAAVLTNAEGDVVFISGRTGKYLEPAAGKANWNILAMAREGLRYELAGAFQRALKRQGSAALRGLKVGTDGGEQRVDVTIRRLDEPGPLQGMVMIVFTDVAAITGDARYLQLAERFSHRQILDPLLQKQDQLTGLHANTQIPKVVGFERPLSDAEAGVGAT